MKRDILFSVFIGFVHMRVCPPAIISASSSSSSESASDLGISSQTARNSGSSMRNARSARMLSDTSSAVVWYTAAVSERSVCNGFIRLSPFICNVSPFSLNLLYHTPDENFVGFRCRIKKRSITASFRHLEYDLVASCPINGAMLLSVPVSKNAMPEKYHAVPA